MIYIVATHPGYTSGDVTVHRVFESRVAACAFVKYRPGLAIYPDAHSLSDMTFNGEVYMVPGYKFSPLNERWFR